jgi:poly-beta-1,6-N-acetyl-D-glucosamine synthase
MYAVVTPVRDEAPNLSRLAGCLLAQTQRPAAWIVVDNGSVDATPAVAEDLARRHPWIRALSIPGGPVAARGGQVVRALEAGIAALGDLPEIVVKLDADVTMGPRHFELLVAEFEADARLGIASGSRHEWQRGAWRQQYLTGTSVEGQCRAYRRACLVEISPLEQRLGWDGLDEMHANHLGWATRTFRDLSFRHHRAVAERERSRLAAWVAQGEANHYMGYRPSYAFLRALRRAARDPAALGLAWGYAVTAVRGRPRDEIARSEVRRRQALRRLPARARETLGRA